MEILKNTYRGTRLRSISTDIPFPSVDIETVDEVLEEYLNVDVTPLVNSTALAQEFGIGSLHIKDERGRMGLGSFKALGAAYVIATMAKNTGNADKSTALAGETFITPSAGNHGLSLAAGAQKFGANAVVYIAETVPKNFAERLRNLGATVVREGHDYEASMVAAMKAKEANGWTLVSDTSWDEYYKITHLLMEGYVRLADEAVREASQKPTHIFLQAGVGGFAGAIAAFLREKWGDEPLIYVVEPDEAPALIESIKVGKCLNTTGGESSMGRLDCKEPSLIALAGLARDADYFITISEEQGEQYMPMLADHDLATTPSGGAGLSAVFAGGKELGLDENSRVLCFITECA
ncbi:MAG: pyridoxal-phosphate dependent enzyme [Hyphomicrobiales bacterium]